MFIESESNNTPGFADSIVSGDIVTAQIIDSSDIDYFAISVASAGVLSLQFDVPTNVSYQDYFDLGVFDSSGTQLGYFSTGVDEAYELGLESAGTYYIGVSASDYLDTGQYVLTSIFTAGNASNYETESNNTLVTADAIVSGATITAQIADYADVDYFSISVASAGALSLQFDVPTNVSYQDYFDLGIFDSSGTQLGYFSTGVDEAYELGLESAGTYYIGVSASDYLDTGQYVLTSTFTAGNASSYESEGNDTFANADNLTDGVAITGQLQSSSDIDVFSIYLAEAGVGTLSFDAPTNSDYAGYFTVSVYAPDGRLVTAVETGKDLTVEGPLSATGTYYFTIESGDWYYTSSSYQVTVALSPGLSDEYENEPNDEYANYLSAGSIKRGSLSSTSDIDWFYLHADANTNLNISFDSPLASDLNYFNVWVYDDLGNLLSRQATGSDFAFDVTAVKAAEYYIGITSSTNYSSLEYALTATLTDASGTQESEPNDLINDANVVTLDTWFKGQLSLPEDPDYFRLELLAAGDIRLEFDTPTDSSFDTFFTLDIFDADGLFLVAYELGQDAVLNIEAQIAGTYFMRVSASDFYTDQSYRFKVSLHDSFSPPTGAIVGTTISDILVGDSSDNLIYGMGGNDLVNGGAGEDTVVFQAPISTLQISEVAGITSVRGNYASGLHAYSFSRVWNTEALQANDSSVSLTSVDVTPIFGSSDSDRLIGTSADDLFDGLGGNDFIDGGAGSDTLAIFSSRSQFEFFNVSGISRLRGLEGSGEYAGHTQRIVNIETVAFSQTGAYSLVTTTDNLIFGTQSDDTLTGSSTNDTFDGLGGDDFINGGGGFDTLALFARTSDFAISYSDISNEITLVGLEGSDYAASTIHVQSIERIAFTDKYLDTQVRPELLIESTGSFISEAGKTASLQFSLSSLPSSTVFVNLTVDNQLLSNSSVLVFDESNWDQTQTITVSALDDDIYEEQHVGKLTIEVESSDPFYGQLDVATKIFSITDNDVSDRGSVEGVLWADTNFDGVQDAGEYGLVGWTVFVDANSNGQLEVDEKSVTTDISGYYRLDEIEVGNHTIAALQKSGWQQTYPDGDITSATVIQSSVTDIKSDVGDLTIGAITQYASLDSNYQHLGNLTGISEFHSDSRFTDITGSGYSVVVLDSGIDLDHSSFGTDSDGNGVSDRIVYNYDFVGTDGPDGSDGNGHGTHVSGIIGSSDGLYPGIAPGVDLIALRVLDDQGAGNARDLWEALNWVIQNHEEYNVAAVNLSLGFGGFFASPYSYIYASQFKALADAGVTVVSASGNNYLAAYQETGQSVLGVAYPSAEPYSLSVGAVLATGLSLGSYQIDAPPDALAVFSQRDDQLSDVFAPGGGVISSELDGTFTTMSGTSMASPYVAGMVVLAQQLAEKELGRRLSFNEVRSLLHETGADILDGDDENAVVSSELTYKRADMMALAEAILSLKPAGTYTVSTAAGGTVSDINFGFASTGVTQALSTDDLIAGTSNGEIIKAGAGNDEVIGGGGDDELYGEAGDDYLYAGSGNDFVDAGEGDDLIIGGTGAGNDQYVGGTGQDTVSYTSAMAAIQVDLLQHVASSLGSEDAGIGTDTISGIENVVAGRFNDYIVGDDTDNVIDTGQGNDTILPGAGSDEIDGGAGWDTVRYEDNQASYSFEETDLGAYLVTHLASGDVDVLQNVEVLDFQDSSLLIVNPNTQPRPVYFGSGQQLDGGTITINTLSGSFDASMTAGELVLPVEALGAQDFTLTADLSTEGAVGISDVIAQLRHIVGLSTLSDISFAAADNDASGDISISDVISSLRVIVGLEKSGEARLVDGLGNESFTVETLSPELYAVAPGDSDLSWELPPIL